MNNEQDYYKLDRLSNSALSNFKRSPRHYLYFKDNPKEQTSAMAFGSAFHCYILEEDKFKEQYCSVPNDAPDKPTLAMINAKKPSDTSIIRVAWWNEFNKVNGDKITISADDMESIKRMKDALFNHPFASELMMSITDTEKEMLWTDDITGLEMKGKFDGCNDDLTIDLKTCINAHPDSFAIDAFNNAYHRQAALYMDARGRNKMNKGDFYFIAVEKEKPHGVSVLKCSNDLIKHGRFVYGNLLESFCYWQNMGSPNVGYEWNLPFGYSEFHLPNWIK